MSVNSQKPHKKKHLALYTFLFLFLFAVYLLTYTPRINSSDGLAMFATAESLVRRGALDIEQIRWMDLQQGTYGLDGLLYSRKGIGVPIGLLPLTWLGLVTPWFGTVSVSLLFNAFVTALTAVVLMAYLEKLGFHIRTGLIVALTFGLATLAWPYAKSLFSDPFAGLLLLAAAYALLKMSRGAGEQGSRGAKTYSPAPLLPRTLTPPHLRSPADWPKTLTAPQVLYPFLAGLFLGWNVATRYAEALFLPVYGLLLLHYLFTIYDLRFTINRSQFTIHKLRNSITHPLRGKTSSSIIRPIAAFCTPILLIGTGLIAFNLSRYGNPFNTGYLPNETFSAIWWEGIIGQLVSPGRGLLLYSPILVLSFWGLIPFFRRYRAEALLAVSVIIIHLLLYGKWFMWHGGYAWGPRFMVPTLPFWCLFLAPVIAILDFRFWIFDLRSKIQNPKLVLSEVVVSKMLGVIFILLFLLSLIPQFLTVTIDFTPFQNSLLETGLPLFARQTFFNPQYAALIGAWNFISLDSLDLAWAWQGQINGWLLAILAANVIITGFYLIINYQLSITNDQSIITSSLPFLSTLIAVIALLAYAHTLPAKSLQEAISVLNNTARSTDAIITNDPEIAMPFAELYKGHAPVLGLNNVVSDDIAQRLDETMATHSQIWWLPNWLPPDESAIEQTLLAQGFKAREDNFEGQRLVLFATPPELSSFTKKESFDGRINLTAIAYLPDPITGAAFPIELQWHATTPITEDYHVFVHLTDEAGRIVAQADGQPGQWHRPTSTWQVEETIIDRHGLWIPPDTRPGEYQLGIGLYRPEDGQRLHLAEGKDTVQFKVIIN